MSIFQAAHAKYYVAVVTVGLSTFAATMIPARNAEPVKAEKITPGEKEKRAPDPPVVVAPPASPPSDDDDEFTDVKIRGRIEFRSPSYSIVSQNRLWKLDLQKDKVLIFMAKALTEKPVLVTGRLRVTDGKLDTVIVSRIEPLDGPKE